MREFKGTPGPWSVDPASSSGIEVITEHEVKVCDIIADNDEDLITELEWDNARLISAAPDLLASLQHLVHLHMCEQEGISSGQPTATQWFEAVDQASAAVNKALGEE